MQDTRGPVVRRKNKFDIIWQRLYKVDPLPVRLSPGINPFLATIFSSYE